MSDQNHDTALAAWLADSRLARFLGRAAALRLEALGWVLRPQGRTLASIARQHGAKKQLLSRYAREASRIFQIENAAQLQARRQR